MKNQLLFCFKILFFLTASFQVLAQQWTPIPLVSQTTKDQGNLGGEGCQVVQALEIDHTNGLFLLMGTDVGGIYRSIDGGKVWHPCNLGYSPRGNAGFAIDPNNSKRALAVGANSTKNQSHGLYLTTDQGASWKQVLQESNYDGYRSFADKVEFVKSSFDAVLGYSKTAYWSNPAGGIYKSGDGGLNWSKVHSSYGNSILKVNPDKGDVYVANSTGFYKSVDGAVSFTKKSSEVITDMDVVITAVDKVFITTATKIMVSDDAGETFKPIASFNFPSKVATLNVSEANPDYMAVCNKINDWGGPIYYSSNGGINWSVATRSNTNAFMPYNDRLQKFAWHPTDKNKVWALGGDWISSSKDGGKNFAWDANGYNGILVGGFFNFNLGDPKLLFVASQDYNGAFSKDNGQTWKYCNASNLGWGGFTYGAYAANANVLVTQNSPGWGQDGKLTISKNGGATFTNTTLTCTGLDVGCGDPKDPNVIYFSNYYSKDLGNTWKPMTDCQGVFIANIYGEKEVYGANGNRVLKSVDKGDSWTTVTTLSANVQDIAIDQVLNRLYIVVSGDRLFQFDSGVLKEITSSIPKDQYNNIGIQSVAVDPQDPKIVYCAGAKNVYKSDATVKRSLDAGKTWQIITPNTRTNNGIELGDGANEVFAIRVNPLTRELWAAGGCYGIWKEAGINTLSVQLSAPASKSVLAVGKELILKTNVAKAEQPITKVEFYVNNEKIGESQTAPYLLSWTFQAIGNFQIQAKVIDQSGNSAQSPMVPITVQASLSPEVALTSPEKNQSFTENTDVLIAANATDLDGTVAKLEFFNGNIKIGESFTAPYSMNWQKVPAGSYTITAKATDNTGMTMISAPVSIQVNSILGSIEYLENFDDDLAQDWIPGAGTWIVENKQLHHTSNNGIDLDIYNGTTFFNYTYTAKIQPQWDNNFGMVFNFIDSKNYYKIEMDANPMTAILYEVKNGTEKKLGETTYIDGGAGIYSTIKVTNDGRNTTVEVNGKIIFSKIATTSFSYGKIGLYAWWQPIWFDDIQVSAANKEPPLGWNSVAELESAVKIYPNPLMYGDLTIQLPKSERNIRIAVLNLAGQILLNKPETDIGTISIASKTFPANGIYIVKISTEKNFYQQKIIYQGS